MSSLGFNSFVGGCQFFYSHKTWEWCSLKIFACLLLALSSNSFKTHMVMECWFLPGFLIPQQVLNCVNVFVKDKSCYGYNSPSVSLCLMMVGPWQRDEWMSIISVLVLALYQSNLGQIDVFMQLSGWCQG